MLLSQKADTLKYYRCIQVSGKGLPRAAHNSQKVRAQLRLMGCYPVRDREVTGTYPQVESKTGDPTNKSSTRIKCCPERTRRHQRCRDCASSYITCQLPTPGERFLKPPRALRKSQVDSKQATLPRSVSVRSWASVTLASSFTSKLLCAAVNRYL